ncbi:MAG: DUF3253 domain-containing protein [Pseudomonadota bacterium]
MRNSKATVPSSLQLPPACISCGRKLTLRARWRGIEEKVKYCSEACRRRRIRPVDRELEHAIQRLLDQRSPTGSICPSEAARHVAVGRGANWRELMEPARRAARRLVHAGMVEIVQRGRVVDPSAFRGPIRIRGRTP